jgi:hypothetical protein
MAGTSTPSRWLNRRPGPAAFNSYKTAFILIKKASGQQFAGILPRPIRLVMTTPPGAPKRRYGPDAAA